MREQISRRRLLALLFLGAATIAATILTHGESVGYGRGRYGSGGFGR